MLPHLWELDQKRVRIAMSGILSCKLCAVLLMGGGAFAGQSPIAVQLVVDGGKEEGTEYANVKISSISGQSIVKRYVAIIDRDGSKIGVAFEGEDEEKLGEILVDNSGFPSCRLLANTSFSFVLLESGPRVEIIDPIVKENPEFKGKTILQFTVLGEME